MLIIYNNLQNIFYQTPLAFFLQECYYDYTKKAPILKWMLQVYSNIVLMDTAYPVGQTGQAFLFLLVPISLIEKGKPVYINLGGYHPVMGTFRKYILTRVKLNNNY